MVVEGLGRDGRRRGGGKVEMRRVTWMVGDGG